MVRSPAWTRDELILACDLVVQNHWKELRQHDSRVAELSELLRSLPIHPPIARPETFRNPNSVSRKTTDIATHHPDYRGKPTRGGALDELVLNDFRAFPEEMHATAEAIRQAAAAGSFDAALVADADLFDEEDSAREGRLLQALSNRHERDPKLRTRKIREFLRTHDRVRCEVCTFDFEAIYGDRGKDYIEVHHKTPLHESGETRTRTADLILLCSNCHRMIHRGSRWLHPDELRELLASNHC
ncbi:HNH endonuclease [Nocardia sp. NPDC051030]|uniref:HNH endonuclease n=1 Tax=Nocardia sp. NPDC051030 TaxID=3155162 RepID=UPI00343C665F